MGGNALSFQTRRIDTLELHQMELDLKQVLFREFEVHFPVPYNSKENHGDIDMVIYCGVDRCVVEYIITDIIKTKELVKNKDIWSFEYDMVQIDIVFSDYPEYTAKWMSYNDLSNLVGRIYHKMGLKFGHDSLRLPVRDNDHLLGEVNVSVDIETIFSFAGYNWHDTKNLNTLEDIYKFVAAGSYFNPDIFLLDNRNAKSRVRDKKRPTYTGFLKWIEEQPEGSLTRYEFNSDKSVYLKPITNYFGYFVGNHVSILFEQNEETKAIKKKFNGELVSKLTGLRGKELGVFMVTFKQRFDLQYFDEEVIPDLIKVHLHHYKKENK